MVCALTKRELRSIQRLAHRLEDQGLKTEGATLRSILRMGSDRREVRAAVAARLLRVTPQTIRNWVKSGRLSGRIDETGHVFVAVEALRPTIEMDAAMPFQPDSASDISMDIILAEIEADRTEQLARQRQTS